MQKISYPRFCSFTLLTSAITIITCVAALSASAQTSGTLKSYFRIDVAPGTTLYDSVSLWERRGGAGGCMYPDIDGDGIPEIMLTSRDQNSDLRLHQLRMRSDGTVKSAPPNTNMQTYSGKGDVSVTNFSFLGTVGAMTHIGDLNGDGVPELAIGNSIGPNGTGEFYIVFMNSRGTVDSLRQIRANKNGLDTTMTSNNIWGNPLAALGDLDGDGVPDLATSQNSVDGNRGEIWILFMKRDGRVKSWKLIKNGTQNLPTINIRTRFGLNLDGIGDLDRDGVRDMVISSIDSDLVGSIWTLFLNSDGTVKHTVRNRPNTTGFPVAVSSNTYFGGNVKCIGDVDGDTVVDLAVTELSYPNTSNPYGRIHIVMMNRDGTVKSSQVIDKVNSDLGTLADNVSFGYTMFPMGDFNKDGIPDVGVGMPDDDAANPSNLGENSGGFYILNLNGVPTKTSTGDIITNHTRDFYAYPNPAVDRLIIRNRGANTLLIDNIRILDASGRLVWSNLINSGSATIEINSLTPGNYYIQVYRGKSAQTIVFTKK